jgi:signal transduction histidine kinase
MTTLNHEINNPLTVIAGNVELISSYLDESNTPIQQKLNLILQEVRRLGRTLQLLANMETPVVETYLEGREMFNPEASSFLVG